jgi:hypothetical protein
MCEGVLSEKGECGYFKVGVGLEGGVVVRARNVRRGWSYDVIEKKYRLNIEGMEISCGIRGV